MHLVCLHFLSMGGSEQGIQWDPGYFLAFPQDSNSQNGEQEYGVKLRTMLDERRSDC